MLRLQFPQGFIWGAATSAYQIEGGYDQDGKGMSVWDHFVRRRYSVVNGDKGDIACDHYNHMPQDVSLMKEFGLNSYSFSISWPRIYPRGRGQINEKGLDFYDGLVDELLGAGIIPKVTLNHWDFPQALQELGGWLNREMVDWFVDYARVVFDRLGDRVSLWVTHNEPWVIAFLGYAMGVHAPGFCNYSQAFQTVHHLLLSHGKTVQLFHHGGYKGKIGIVLNIDIFRPASDREEDIEACRRVYDENASLFLEPLYHARYPEDFFKWIGKHQPQIEDGDMEIINQPTDFLGLNYYKSYVVSYNVDGWLLKAKMNPLSAPGWGFTSMDWGIDPSGLLTVLLDINRRCNNPELMITESGCALPDLPDEHGFVKDLGRISFLHAHLQSLHEAIDLGLNVGGFYVWSLMDNFEWAWGFSQRFGLVRVDFNTLKRIPKQSAYWYKNVIEENAIYQ